MSETLPALEAPNPHPIQLVVTDDLRRNRLTVLLRLILDSAVTDTHGMKGFRRALVEDLVPHVMSTTDLFDTELVIRAERAGYRIVEVPVVVAEMRTAKSSLIKRAPRTVLGLIRMRSLLRRDHHAAKP